MDVLFDRICSSNLFGDHCCHSVSLPDSGELMVRLSHPPVGVGYMWKLNFRRLPDRAVSNGDPSCFHVVVGAKSFSHGITCQQVFLPPSKLSAYTVRFKCRWAFTAFGTGYVVISTSSSGSKFMSSSKAAVTISIARWLSSRGTLGYWSRKSFWVNIDPSLDRSGGWLWFPHQRLVLSCLLKNLEQKPGRW